ncbi:cytochrome P450 [Sphingorhabdus sp. Alg239-R122]|uniref:cytochrome P450 n=1 Tax=Sphingorhabdus sp. Alg239-R122 TaxID=2305989 RepID=UPI0013DC2A09|nr:cytochrome P450 [Sphingorhabdus sp. Alg239-R122]
MATAAPKCCSTEKPVQTDPFDMTLPDMYREDRWQEPFRKLRETAPVYKVKESEFGAHWNVSTYKPIQHVEALPDIYSSSYEHGGITIADLQEEDREDEFILPMFIAMDRPKHTGQRRTVAPKFTPSNMKEMADDIRHRTGEILDDLPMGKAFDWVDRVSIELTTQMLALLFDFPWEDRRKLTFWSDWAGDIEIARNPDLRQERVAHLYEMGAYFKKLWDERVGQPPAPDLISMMIHSDATNHMDEMEFMGNLVLLIVGGNDTTRNSMSGAIYGLDKFPDEREKLEQNPELIANATSEIIRWQTPLAHMRRTALQDAELFGADIKKGDKLALWYISGNRDESVFENPDKLIVDRENARRHLAFGYGIHRCVGARLAELQISVLLEEMAKRRIRANVLSEPERVSACFVHGYKSMDVELTTY